MKFFTILLLASLALASLAAVHEPKDELNSETPNTDAGAQFGQPSQPSEENIFSENLSKEPIIIKEELISKEDVVIETTKPKSQKVQVQHPKHQERPSNEELLLQQTTELMPQAATTSEGKLAKFGHAVGKDLDNMIKGFINTVEDIIPGTN